MDICFEQYGKSWWFKRYCDGFERDNANNPNLRKLSELNIGDVFEPPSKITVCCLIGENLYFNYCHHDIPHQISHEDPYAIVLLRPEFKWDLEKKELIEIKKRVA